MVTFNVTLLLAHVILPLVVAVTDGIEESVGTFTVTDATHPVILSITLKV